MFSTELHLARLKRRSLLLFGLLLSFTFALLVGISSPAAVKSTEILWDTYGVPHVYAKDSKSLFQAFGWAQMQSHGNLLLRLYGQARGQAAQYWGEDYLESDRWVRTMGVPARAQEWYKAQNPKFRSYLDAFAAGINRYAQEHPDLIDDQVEVVLPITAVDVLAHGQRILNFTFVVDPQQVAGVSKEAHSPGSNGWAIAPAHSASGKTLLLANPHLYWSDLFLWYEAQLTAPGIDAYGATLVGTPVLEIAFNDFLGWTHTVNTHDGWDAYELKLAKGGYQWDGQIKAFETQKQILKVKQADGTLREEPLVVRRSIHGPIVSQQDNTAIAIRVVGLNQPRALEQWWDMARATTFNQFETALKRLQIPMFTVMYADRQGHIMHLFNGQVPVRSQGNFEYWTDIIPGDTSKTLWTKTHPYQDLPRVLDPPSGWLQNANDPPWTTTVPLALNPSDYPAYMAPRDSMNLRAQRAAQMLSKDAKISFDELVKYKYSTRMELADRLLDDLIPLARRGSPLTRRSADVLAKWDRQTNPDSRGAVLFAAWAQAVDLTDIFATDWNPAAPLTTPDGIADPAKAIAALAAAATKVEAAYGDLDVEWGKVFRIHYGDVDLPANGAEDPLGVFRSLWFAPTAEGRFQTIGGDSFVAAVEFSNPVKAKVLTSYGNSTQPNSPHQTDQLKLFANQKLRDVWRSRKDISDHLAARQKF